MDFVYRHVPEQVWNVRVAIPSHLHDGNGLLERSGRTGYCILWHRQLLRLLARRASRRSDWASKNHCFIYVFRGCLDDLLFSCGRPPPPFFFFFFLLLCWGGCALLS